MLRLATPLQSTNQIGPRSQSQVEPGKRSLASLAAFASLRSAADERDRADHQ